MNYVALAAGFSGWPLVKSRNLGALKERQISRLAGLVRPLISDFRRGKKILSGGTDVLVA